jgi:type II secretion system protein G
MRILQENRRMHAFTLVELMVVVLILGALAFVAVPRIGQSVDNAEKTACETNVDIFNQALEQYYLTNGVYPASLGVIKNDETIFPDGPPKCPITNKRYSGMTANDRLKTTDHNH